MSSKPNFDLQPPLNMMLGMGVEGYQAGLGRASNHEVQGQISAAHDQMVASGNPAAAPFARNLEQLRGLIPAADARYAQEMHTTNHPVMDQPHVGPTATASNTSASTHKGSPIMSRPIKPGLT